MVAPLPTPRTSFVGRVHAAATLTTLLATTRLLTITGSGGSGKTRMALHVARQHGASAPYPLAWLDLSALADPALLPHALAAALGLREQPGLSPTALLLERLGARELLLVLDSCEHLRAACAELLGTLLTPTTGLRVLATSRAPLGAPGELIWPIPLLELPAPQQPLAKLAGVESVRLFVERARAVVPTFALDAQNQAAVAQICRRLEGLPLAIELAAARVAMLTPQQIADRLDNSIALLTRAAPASDARHGALRAALDWSYALLAAPEQQLFTRLALFAGGCTIDAVEGVCAGAGLRHAELLDLLSTLHERSLLVVVEAGERMRYRLLEPVRQYAAALLQAAGDENGWRHRHRDYFLGLAEQAAARLDDAGQAEWLARLDAEHENLRAALAWCAEAEQPGPGLRLCAALALFWARRGHLAEGQRWLQLFLSRGDPHADPALYVRALNASAALLARRSDFVAARAQLERSLALARHAEDEAGMAEALVELGLAHWDLGDFGAAREALRQAITIARDGAHTRLLTRALLSLGLVQQFQGEPAAARATYEQALATAQGLGNSITGATLLLNLATLALQSGDQGAARRRYAEALALYRALGVSAGIADTLVNLADLAVDQGDLAAAAAACDEAETLYRAIDNQGDLGYVLANRGEIALAAGQEARAREQFEQALELFRAVGNRRLVGRCLGQLAAIAARAGQLAEAAALATEALSLRRAIDHRPGMVFSLDGPCLALAMAAGLPGVAARLLGAADAARAALPRPRNARETRAVEQARQQLLARLGESSFGALWGEGQAMELGAAADYALASLAPAVVARPRPELRIFALGPLRVYRGEQLLTSADWAYTKARELLLYLVCHQHASREQIGVELWPEASAEQVRQRFSTALAQARGALGRQAEWLTLAEGRYSFNRALPFWLDVDAFEAALAEARSLLGAGTQDKRAARLLEEALGLYQGDFAEDLVDGTWLAPRREALHQAYLEALLALARLHTGAGRDEAARALFRRALATDPYLEEAHHALIQAAIRQGRRDLALAQYEALASALAELGATPDPAIAALVERLRHGQPL